MSNSPLKFAACITEHDGKKYIFSRHTTIELAQKQCRLLQAKRQNNSHAKFYRQWMIEGKAHHYGETYSAESIGKEGK